jgi:hypothetical protein
LHSAALLLLFPVTLLFFSTEIFVKLVVFIKAIDATLLLTLLWNRSTVKPPTIISEGTTENKQWMRENDSCGESILMCHKHEKTKSENFTFFLLTKNEQIKGNLKYLSTNNILHVSF